MQPNNKDFKALQAKWYAKLENSGFEDIEDQHGHLDRHKSLSNIVTHYDQTSFELKQEYYRLAGQFLHDHKFKSKKEMLIWQYHCEGMSIRDIAKKMKTYRRKIHETLQALNAEMRGYVRTKK